ncbi:uncharacterized protein LOC133035137 [Cannabis sativa]|uniref:uncharacterized protein LOC133035137 n=2 Tax=Cannabis sativa TaxID=3483 RepID=UPI0029C9FC5F|nr:uncharacterized protein LOC133035137 [Cannabis sativa]
MHIEKNVCESIIGTLLDIPGKTKDGVNSRLDLVEMGIRQSLAPEKKGERLYLPPACFTLSKKEKQTVCKSLANMKVPDGYSSNIKNLVNETELKLMGLKSHDCHALMQHLLPIAIRSVLPKNVRECLTHVCIFFNRLCGKELELDKLDALHEHVVKTLCNLEKFFPPSFFDIMIHLMVHLVREARLCGPVWARWMYPFERNMKVLKSYVRNHYRPEACMVECYISEEAVEFCSEYMAGVEAIGISKPRTDPDDVDRGLRGKGTMVTVSKLELDQAQLVVMNNNAEVQPYITDHMELLQSMVPRNQKNKQKWVADQHRQTFIGWLRNTIIAKLNEPNHGVSDVLSRIALGPTFAVAKHKALTLFFGRHIWESINGLRKIFKFYDPELLTVHGISDEEQSQSFDDAARRLANWLSLMNSNHQMFFIPWNIGMHWTLVVVAPNKIIHLNPLKGRPIPEEIEQMIGRAFMYIGDAHQYLGPWQGIAQANCPRQPKSQECGFYVLKYMTDIVARANPNRYIEDQKAFGGKKQYDPKTEILPLQRKWIEQLMAVIHGDD